MLRLSLVSPAWHPAPHSSIATLRFLRTALADDAAVIRLAWIIVAPDAAGMLAAVPAAACVSLREGIDTLALLATSRVVFSAPEIWPCSALQKWSTPDVS